MKSCIQFFLKIQLFAASSANLLERSFSTSISSLTSDKASLKEKLAYLTRISLRSARIYGVSFLFFLILHDLSPSCWHTTCNIRTKSRRIWIKKMKFIEGHLKVHSESLALRSKRNEVCPQILLTLLRQILRLRI